MKISKGGKMGGCGRLMISFKFYEYAYQKCLLNNTEHHFYNKLAFEVVSVEYIFGAIQPINLCQTRQFYLMILYVYYNLIMS